MFRPRPVHLFAVSVNRDGMTTHMSACGVWNPRRTTLTFSLITCPECQHIAIDA